MSQPAQAAAPFNSLQLIPPDKFDFNNASEWPKWIRRFERFRVASNLDKQTQEYQVNTLMYTLGDGAEDILNVFPLNEDQKKSYEDVKQAFGKHCASKRNIIFERARFNRRNQEPGESAEAFITAVHSLAEHCAFGNVREELIRDRIVVGLRDAKLSESLQLDPELTLVKTIARVCQSEGIMKQQPILHGSLNEKHAETQTGTKGQTYSSQVKPENNSDTVCGRYGKATENQRKDCSAEDSECPKCKQKGHFALKCRSTGGITEDSADYEDEEDVAFLGEAGFTFSAPVAKLGPSMSNGNLASSIATAGFASHVAQTSPSPNDAPQQTSAQFTAPSTTSTTTSTLFSSSGLGDLFKAPAGWRCDVCLVQNKPSDVKCVCCMTPQPSSSSSKSRDSKPAATSVGLESSSTNSTSTTGFGTMFSKPVGTWDCDTCLVLNKPDAVKCVACETAKPGTGLKPSLTLPSAFSAVKTVSNPTAPITTGFIGFGDKFKKPEGAWECDTCTVQNKAENTKCVACMSAKPGASTGLGDLFKPPVLWRCDVCLMQNKPSDVKCVCCMNPQPSSSSSKSRDSKPKACMNSTSTTGFGTMFSKPAGTWDCDTCLVLNKPDAVKCVACETAKPGTALKPSLTLPSAFSAVKTVSNPTAPITTGFIGFGDKFKKPEGAWECDTCMVQNKAEDTKCVACMSAKPGASTGLGDLFKPPVLWRWDVCLVQNKPSYTKCFCCMTPQPSSSSSKSRDSKPAATSVGLESSSTNSTSTTGGGIQFGGANRFGPSNNSSGVLTFRT